MGKRFVDTELPDKEWWQMLSPELKSLWEYLRLKCDISGVWKPNKRQAEFIIGQSVNWELATQMLKSQVEILADGKWWLKDFCYFQYGKLSSECVPHKAVISLLEKHGLKDRVTIQYANRIRTVKDKDNIKTIQDKDKDNAVKEQKQNHLKECEVILDFFNQTCKRKFSMTPERMRVISKRLAEGKSISDLKKAIAAFSEDDWSERSKFTDIVYAIGVKSKVDNFDKWFNTPLKQSSW